MKQIPLRKRDGSIRAYALVDDEDYERLLPFRWWQTHYGYVMGFIPGAGRNGARRGPNAMGPGRRVWMHRFILDVADKSHREVEVDHISGDKLDNQRSNLRVATHAENMQNIQPRRKSSSRYRGVTRRSYGWQARVRHGDKHHYLGTYQTEEEAAAAAAAFRAEHMPFAVLEGLRS